MCDYHVDHDMKIMSNISQCFVITVLALSVFLGSFVPSTALAGAIPMNTAIKGSTPAVYWYASDGKLYAFPNAATYYTWFPTFKNVVTVSDSVIAGIPKAWINVTYRPGAKLVKVQADPKVFAVDRYGVLRWVTSEANASRLYGYFWQSQLHVIPDQIFGNYNIGQPIYLDTDYSVSDAYNGVTNPSDNIYHLGYAGYQGSFLDNKGLLTITSNRSTIPFGQTAVITATYAGVLPQGGYMEFRSIFAGHSELISGRCYSSSCSVTVADPGSYSVVVFNGYSQPIDWVTNSIRIQDQ